jgi:hypothetical protein
MLQKFGCRSTLYANADTGMSQDFVRRTGLKILCVAAGIGMFVCKTCKSSGCLYKIMNNLSVLVYQVTHIAVTEALMSFRTWV